MMTLTPTQRRALAKQGLIVCIEYASGVAKCLLPDGNARIYATDDLARLAEPRTLKDKITAWMGVAS